MQTDNEVVKVCNFENNILDNDSYCLENFQFTVAWPRFQILSSDLVCAHIFACQKDFGIKYHFHKIQDDGWLPF